MICLICALVKRWMQKREEENETIERTFTSESSVNKRLKETIETEQREITLLDKAIAGRPSALVELKLYDRHIEGDSHDHDLEIQ